jgi:UDP-2,3-diacylglucosamine pyrophosphatase LpxH
MAKATYVVSDLHIGDRDSARYNFGYGDKLNKFRRFLEVVGDSPLLVLGDLFEFWQADIDRAIITNRDLLDTLSAMNVSYIPGNHDQDLSAFYAGTRGETSTFIDHPFFRDRAVRDLGGCRFGPKTFYFRHGHEGDAFNDKPQPDMGRLVTILVALIEDKLKSRYFANNVPIEAYLTTLSDKLLCFIDIFTKFLRPPKRASNMMLGDANDMAEGADPDEGRLATELESIQETGNERPEAELAQLMAEAIERHLDEALREAASNPEAENDLLLGDSGFLKRADPLGPRAKFLPEHLKSMKEIWDGLSTPDPANTVLMVGHTHLPGRCGEWYYNSGSWSDNGNDVLTIDNETGTVDFFTWRGDGLEKMDAPEDFARYLKG